MISGFEIDKKLPENKNIRFSVVPIKVKLYCLNSYGTWGLNEVEVHAIDLHFSFKTYKKWFFGPQVCEPYYYLSVVLTQGKMAWSEDLEKFINNLENKKAFEKTLQEVFTRVKSEAS